ncbi:MAG: ATP-binding cassette domain-containing protein, partial [Alphaproteobacteria bacterium]
MPESAPGAAAAPQRVAAILPLRLEAVTFEAAGKRILGPLSATFEAGPLSVILGPNGAGKSVLLRLCHGLIRPNGGRIVWAAADSGTIRHAQAMVFQRPVLLRRSVAANVAYALSLRGVARNERPARVAAALA